MGIPISLAFPCVQRTANVKSLVWKFFLLLRGVYDIQAKYVISARDFLLLVWCFVALAFR